MTRESEKGESIVDFDRQSLSAFFIPWAPLSAGRSRPAPSGGSTAVLFCSYVNLTDTQQNRRIVPGYYVATPGALNRTVRTDMCAHIAHY